MDYLLLLLLSSWKQSHVKKSIGLISCVDELQSLMLSLGGWDE